MKSIKKKVAAVVYWKYADLNSRLLSNNIELVHGLRALILTSGGSRTTHQLSDQVNWIYERIFILIYSYVTCKHILYFTLLHYFFYCLNQSQEYTFFATNKTFVIYLFLLRGLQQFCMFHNLRVCFILILFIL